MVYKIFAYSLHHNKEQCLFEIKKNKTMGINVPESCEIKDDDLIRYNDCHYISNDRNALVDKARELRDEWIKEYEEKIAKLKSINFKKSK